MSLAKQLAIGIGYLRLPELELLQSLTRELPEDAICVNIGAGAGTSIIGLLEIRPDLHVTSVDNDPEVGVPQFRQSGMQSRIHQLIGDSRDLGRTFKGKIIDWLFIDDGHLSHEIRGDLDEWTPHVKEGGLVLIHDYDSVHWPGVKAEVDAWVERDSPFAVALAETLVVFRVTK